MVINWQRNGFLITIIIKISSICNHSESISLIQDMIFQADKGNINLCIYWQSDAEGETNLSLGKPLGE